MRLVDFSATPSNCASRSVIERGVTALACSTSGDFKTFLLFIREIELITILYYVNRDTNNTQLATLALIFVPGVSEAAPRTILVICHGRVGIHSLA
jgi:hypothetical protein